MNTQNNLKTKVLLFLLLVAAGLAKAQESLGIIKENAEWNILWKSTSSPTQTLITETIKLGEDTLVGGATYKKLLQKQSSPTDFGQGCLDYCLHGLIREEPTGKVFFKPNNQDCEYLLYDFGMVVSDTAVMYWCQNPNCEILIRIDSISTQNIAGLDRRVFYVSSKDQYGDDWRWLNTWIEGLGALEGLLYSCHIVNAGGITLHELLCYHENDEVLYVNEHYNTCIVDSNNTSISETVQTIMRFDPHSQNLCLLDSSNVKYITIYDMLGRVVFNQKICLSQTIDLSPLPNGTYIVFAQTEKQIVSTFKFVK